MLLLTSHFEIAREGLDFRELIFPHFPNWKVHTAWPRKRRPSKCRQNFGYLESFRLPVFFFRGHVNFRCFIKESQLEEKESKKFFFFQMFKEKIFSFWFGVKKSLSWKILKNFSTLRNLLVSQWYFERTGEDWWRMNFWIFF